MHTRTVMVVAAALTVAACSRSGMYGGAAPAPAAAPAGPMAAGSLYERLGGRAAIVMVVDTFTAHLAADDRINMMFRGVDVNRVRQRLVEQLCQATGGPCTYTGRSMREAHRGLRITEEQWNITVQHLVMVLDQFRVPEREMGELLGLLAPMKPDIVGQ